MNNYYVYLLLDPMNFYLPFYVGKGKSDRWESHLKEKSESESSNRHKFHRIQYIRKNGYEPVHLKWEENLNEDEAYELEADLIKRFGRKSYDEDGILTNVTIGELPPNHTGRKRSEETRVKISQALKGRKLDSEHARKCGLANLGKIHGTPPEDRREAISESNKTFWKNMTKEQYEERRKNMSKAHKGKSRTGLVNWKIVKDIRRMDREGYKARDIKAKYPQIHSATISDIKAHRTWKE